MAKAKKEEKKIEEKHYTVSLTGLYNNPRPKRAYRAINFLKKFVFKHLRITADNVYISQALNEAVWAKGREHIPRKLKIKIIKEDEKAKVYLEEEKIIRPKKEDKEKKKEEKKTEPKETEAEKEEKEKKKAEKKAKEKAADVSSIKRGTGK